MNEGFLLKGMNDAEPAKNIWLTHSLRRRSEEFVHEFHQQRVANEAARGKVYQHRKNSYRQVFFTEHGDDAQRNGEYRSQKEEYRQPI